MLSIIDYTASAGQTNFAIPFPYFERGHLHVYVNDIETNAYTFVSSSSIQLTTGASEGDTVRIRRITPYDAPLVDYSDGATLLETDLDGGDNQTLYVLQELKEDPSTELPVGSAITALTDVDPGLSKVPGSVAIYGSSGLLTTVPSPNTGEILIGDTETADVVRWLPKGNTGDFLQVDDGEPGKLKWTSGIGSVLTTIGDILYASAIGVASRLGIGVDGAILVARPDDDPAPPLEWVKLAGDVAWTIETQAMSNKTFTDSVWNGGTINGPTINGATLTGTVTMPAASVGSGSLKTATGSATCASSATQTGGPGTTDNDSVDVVGNDYQFAPSHTYNTTLNTFGAAVSFSAGDLVSLLADPGTTVYRRTIFTGVDASLAGGGEGGTSTYTLRWRYMTASDNPHIWMVVDQETGEVVATWFSDDPPSDGSSGLLYTKSELRNRFQSIQLTSADLESWSQLSPHADAAQQHIKDSKLRMQHAPMRALQLMANDSAPAQWLSDFCRFDTEAQKVVVAAKSRIDFQREKADKIKEKKK